jgi:thymidylate synthase ThyX
MKISVLNDFESVNCPQVLAMLQAYYSRSHVSIEDRIQQLTEGGTASIQKVKDSLRQFWVGYGHESIADCGVVYLAIEGVSMIAANVIEDNLLFNGQESSTRYIPFDEQPIEFPPLVLGHVQSELEESMKALMSEHTIMTDIFTRSQIRKWEAESNGDKANTAVKRGIRAAVFDVTRCYIPNGTHTQLSWVGSLRNVKDNLYRMLSSPYGEVQQIARALVEQLCSRYPDSFEDIRGSHPIDTRRVWEDAISECAFVPVQWYVGDKVKTLVGVGGANNAGFVSTGQDLTVNITPLSQGHGSSMSETLARINAQRTPGQTLPARFNMVARVGGYMAIDYGCYREFHRHRTFNMNLPVITHTSSGGFHNLHPWYVRRLASMLGDVSVYGTEEEYQEASRSFNHAAEHMNRVSGHLHSIAINHKQFTGGSYPREFDYYSVLGEMVFVEYDAGLSSAIYFAELRSKSTVHGILRGLAQRMADAISQFAGIELQVDSRSPNYEVRGNQTITQNGNQLPHR